MPTIKSDTRIPRLLLRNRNEKKEKESPNNNKKKRITGEILSNPKLKFFTGSTKKTNTKMQISKIIKE
jgi:hypothetical protein